MIKKNVLLKVFTTQIRSAQIFLDPILKCAPARSVYLKALLYFENYSFLKWIKKIF